MKNLNIFIFVLIVATANSQKSNYIIEKLNYHTDKVMALDFSPDGNYLLTGSSDKTIKLIELNSYEKILDYTAHYGEVMDLTFSPSGNNFYSAGDRVIKKWDIEGNEIIIYRGSATYIWSISVNSDETKIISGAYENYARIWDINTGEMLGTFKSHDKSAIAVCFSPNGKIIATGSLDKTVKIWNVETFELIHTFEGHNDNIYSLVFSDDGKYLASASNDNTIKIWDVDKLEFFITLTGHDKGVLSADFSPDGNHLLSGSIDNKIKLWERNTGECIYTYEYHDAVVNDIKFHPEKLLFASASSDKKVVIWEINPEVFVNYYYQDELYEELENSGLWGPKKKGENNTDFKERQEKAQELRNELVNKYYEIYKARK